MTEKTKSHPLPLALQRVVCLPPQVPGCQCFAWACGLAVNLFVLWNFQVLHAHGVQQKHYLGELLVFTKEKVAKSLRSHDYSVFFFQLFRERYVSLVLRLPQLLEQLNRPSFIKLTNFHYLKSDLEVEVLMVLGFKKFPEKTSKLWFSYRPALFTARQLRQVLNKRSS
jgi:hypothetical protein